VRERPRDRADAIEVAIDRGVFARGDVVARASDPQRNGQKPNKRVIRMKATATSGTKPRKDQDSFTFVCLPRTSDCPASPSAAFLP
jgi:hypothetical protein